MSTRSCWRLGGLKLRVRRETCWLRIGSGCSNSLGWSAASELEFGAQRFRPQENGFGLKTDAELSLDCGEDLIAESEDVGGLRVSSLDEGEGVAARDSGRTQCIALVKTGLLHQPGGWHLEEAFSCWIARNGSNKFSRNA